MLDHSHILLVEDDALVSLDIETMLADAGYHCIDSAASIPEAMASLSKRIPGAALLDVNLNGELVFPLADYLRTLGVPMVFVTGHSRAFFPPPHRACAMVKKPYMKGALLDALAGVVRRRVS